MPGAFLAEFELYVMLAIARLGDDAYGAVVRQEIESRTSRPVSIGALYTTLARLEDKGMVILRNSFKARRQFVRLHHAHPRVISPIRRLLRRDPQILKMSWHQALKIERLLAPKGLRFMVRSRRLFRRRR